MTDILLADDRNGLREPSEKVTDFDASLAAFAEEMISKMGDHPGISAPQLGRNIRMFALGSRILGKAPLVMVNPEIEGKGGRDVKYEGCLSLPDRAFSVKRRKKVTVRFQDLNGKRMSAFAKGFKARVIQHEGDHLDGLLIDVTGEEHEEEK